LLPALSLLLLAASAGCEKPPPPPPPPPPSATYRSQEAINYIGFFKTQDTKQWELAKERLVHLGPVAAVDLARLGRLDLDPDLAQAVQGRLVDRLDLVLPQRPVLPAHPPRLRHHAPRFPCPFPMPRPPTRIVPPVGSISRLIIFIVVVLPEPEVPTMTRTSPV